MVEFRVIFLLSSVVSSVVSRFSAANTVDTNRKKKNVISKTQKERKVCGLCQEID